jgi:hypothetical protein
MSSQFSREKRPQPVLSQKETQVSRLRSVPHRKPFVQAVFLYAIHFIGVLASVTTFVVFLIEPSKLATRVLVLCLGFSAITWLIAYFKRRSTHCPLCKGTPLINSGALPHKKAVRFFPLNHGVTAILSIIATQKFRCMDCGTCYDMLKSPAHLRGKNQQADDSEYLDI